MTQVAANRRRHREDWITTRSVRRPTGKPWDIAVDAFLRDAKARNYSPATLTGYRGYLTGPRTRQFLADYAIKKVSDVTPDNLRSFQAELLDVGLSAGTAGTYHRIFRNFLGFCDREGYGITSQSLGVPAPREPVIEPEIFSDADERALLEACRSDRDRILIQFMLRTGLRRSEVINVTVDDIIEGSDGTYVRVRQGKGRKDRIVPLDTGRERFSRQILRYIRVSRPTPQRHRFHACPLRMFSSVNNATVSQTAIKNTDRMTPSTSIAPRFQARANTRVSAVYAPSGNVNAHQPTPYFSRSTRWYRMTTRIASGSHHRPKPHRAVAASCENWPSTTTAVPGKTMPVAWAMWTSVRPPTPMGPRPIQMEGAS